MGVSWGSDTLRDVLFGLVDTVIMWLHGVLDSLILPAANIDVISYISSKNPQLIMGFISASISVIVLTAIYQLLVASLSQDVQKRIVQICLGAAAATILSASCYYVMPWFSKEFVANGNLAESLSTAFGGIGALEMESMTKTYYGYQVCGWDSPDEVANFQDKLWSRCVMKHKDIILKTGGTEETILQPKFAEEWVSKEHTITLTGSGFNNFIVVKTVLAANAKMPEQEAREMIIEMVNGTFNYNEKTGGGWFNGGKYIHQVNEISTFIVGVIAVVLLGVTAIQILNRSFGLAFFFLALPFAAASLCTKEKKAIKAVGSQITLCFLMNAITIATIIFAFELISWFQTTNGLFNFVLILSALLFILSVPQYISMMIGAQNAGIMGGIYSIMMAVNTGRMVGSSMVAGGKGVMGLASGLYSGARNGMNAWSNSKSILPNGPSGYSKNSSSIHSPDKKNNDLEDNNNQTKQGSNQGNMNENSKANGNNKNTNPKSTQASPSAQNSSTRSSYLGSSRGSDENSSRSSSTESRRNLYSKDRNGGSKNGRNNTKK
ncbi:hypothetical protein [Anaerorhabdus sp.]|uniref:hypothetical protein n=1 Tax=Anaerorhabdus sp. TaxID=1872524 RepID=UPI002FC609D6